jgi:hypothetical protein
MLWLELLRPLLLFAAPLLLLLVVLFRWCVQQRVHRRDAQLGRTTVAFFHPFWYEMRPASARSLLC